MNDLRLELRAVVAPHLDGDEEIVLKSVQQAVTAMGAFFDGSIAPYAKPPGSFMVRAEADCSGDAVSLISALISIVGGADWATMGSGDEVEAVWVPKEGALPPISSTVTWAHMQTIPISALPAARRRTMD